MYLYVCSLFFFFFNDTATTEIYTLSLHDALPICAADPRRGRRRRARAALRRPRDHGGDERDHRGQGRAHGSDRKSTRLNSSHANISYAVFCLKKKKITSQNRNLLRQKHSTNYNSS